MKKRFIFDLEGTLLMSDKTKEIDYFRSNLKEEDAKKFIEHILNRNKLLLEYERKYRIYETLTLSKFLTEKMGFDVTEKLIRGWNKLDINPIVLPNVEDTLEYLKCQDKSLVVLTNSSKERVEILLENSELSEYFDEVYTGDICLKPRREAYNNASGLSSSEDCLIIGSDLDHIVASKEMGIDSIYYNPSNDDDYDKKRILSISDIKELKGRY